MSRYRITQIAFLLIMVCTAIAIVVFDRSWIWLLVPIVAYLVIISIGSFNIQWDFYTGGFHQAAQRNEIAITFDDGPDPVVTPKVLELLKRYEARATFFAIGKKVSQAPELLQEIHDRGHVVGNHSFSHHQLFGFFSSRKVQREIEATNDIIDQVIGRKPLLFRPPFGVSNPLIARAVSTADMNVIGWNIRSLDTVQSSPEKVLARIIKRLRPGSVVLLHDNLPHVPEILEGILLHANRHGIKCVDVCTLFEIKGYA